MGIINLILLLLVLSVVGYVAFAKYYYSRKDAAVLVKFKKQAVKIQINLSDIQIRSNDWKEEKENAIDKGEKLWNYYVGDERKNVETKYYNPNILNYRFSVNSDTFHYETRIDYDRQKLDMWFALKQRTYLYYDKRNPANCYIDLEFLTGNSP